jgi:hypothetical protein
LSRVRLIIAAICCKYRAEQIIFCPGRAPGEVPGSGTSAVVPVLATAAQGFWGLHFGFFSRRGAWAMVTTRAAGGTVDSRENRFGAKKKEAVRPLGFVTGGSLRRRRPRARKLRCCWRLYQNPPARRKPCGPGKWSQRESNPCPNWIVALAGDASCGDRTHLRRIMSPLLSPDS